MSYALCWLTIEQVVFVVYKPCIAVMFVYKLMKISGLEQSVPKRK